MKAVLAAVVSTTVSAAERAPPNISKAWDDALMASVELPSVEPAWSPKQITADYYYKIPVRPIYRSYPVYHPDREPPGVIERYSDE